MQEIKKWLTSNMELQKGFDLLKKYCTNKILVRSIVNTKNAKKLEYELKKLAGIPLSQILTQKGSNQELIKQKAERRKQPLSSKAPLVTENKKPLDKILFTLGNAFDNILQVGLSYFKNAKKLNPYLVFMIEFMNFLFDKVVDCFYAIDTNRHVYYNGLDDNYLLNVAKDSNYNVQKLTQKTSTYDKDCHPSIPIEIVFDWGTNICVMCVCQERNYDFLNEQVTQVPVLHFINEFFVKPEGINNVLINDLVNTFSDYYSKHSNRNLIFYRDRHGDKKNPNVANYQSYNKQAIDMLERRGWHVEERVHPGQEPNYLDRYHLWGNLLSEESNTIPKIRFNGSRCKYTLISMNNTNTKDYEGKIVKDKSSERNKNIPQEEATHFSDAADKIVYTKYHEFRQYDALGFVPARV